MEDNPCRNDCDGLDKLRVDLKQCSAEKDAQIDSLSHQVNGIRGDLMRLDGDLKTLTVAVKEMSQSMSVIAANTTEFMEVMHMYQHVKGFSWVVKNGAIALIGASALITAVVMLAGVKIHIGT